MLALALAIAASGVKVPPMSFGVVYIYVYICQAGIHAASYPKPTCQARVPACELTSPSTQTAWRMGSQPVTKRKRPRAGMHMCGPPATDPEALVHRSLHAVHDEQSAGGVLRRRAAPVGPCSMVGTAGGIASKDMIAGAPFLEAHRVLVLVSPRHAGALHRPHSTCTRSTTHFVRGVRLIHLHPECPRSSPVRAHEEQVPHGA